MIEVVLLDSIGLLLDHDVVLLVVGQLVDQVHLLEADLLEEATISFGRHEIGGGSPHLVDLALWQLVGDHVLKDMDTLLSLVVRLTLHGLLGGGRHHLVHALMCLLISVFL